VPQKTKPARSAYTYDPKRATYRDNRSGRYVARTEIRAVIDKALAVEERRLVAIARRLKNGSITLAEWQGETAQAIKEIHLWNAAAARGGWGQLTQADYGRVGATLRVQYQYLDNFALQLYAGDDWTPDDGRFLVRVGMYAQAARNTYEVILADEMYDRGFTMEKNVLHPADHCDGCLEADAMGWQEIGTLVPVGERDCNVNCRCSTIYK
jgi:hypothetical protein